MSSTVSPAAKTATKFNAASLSEPSSSVPNVKYKLPNVETTPAIAFAPVEDI
jgi:hypothetical protein